MHQRLTNLQPAPANDTTYHTAFANLCAFFANWLKPRDATGAGLLLLGVKTKTAS